MSRTPTPEEILARFRGMPVKALEERRRELAEESSKIAAQLGDKNKTVDGQRVDTHSYHDWRNRAVWAKRHIDAELVSVKAALKTANRRFNTDTPLLPADQLKTPDQLIHAALVVLKGIACETEVDDHEQQIINALDAYLREHGKVGA